MILLFCAILNYYNKKQQIWWLSETPEVQFQFSEEKYI